MGFVGLRDPYRDEDFSPGKEDKMVEGRETEALLKTATDETLRELAGHHGVGEFLGRLVRQEQNRRKADGFDARVARIAKLEQELKSLTEEVRAYFRLEYDDVEPLSSQGQGHLGSLISHVKQSYEVATGENQEQWDIYIRSRYGKVEEV